MSKQKELDEKMIALDAVRVCLGLQGFLGLVANRGQDLLGLLAGFAAEC